jgi:hypothetical protein
MAGLDKPAPAGGLILPITVGGTATPFVDSSAGNIPGGNAYVMIFTAGSTLSSTKVAIYDDQILEKTETVTLTLGVGNTTAVLGVNRSFVLSIRDNELRRAYWSTPSSSKYDPPRRPLPSRSHSAALPRAAITPRLPRP